MRFPRYSLIDSLALLSYILLVSSKLINIMKFLKNIQYTTCMFQEFSQVLTKTEVNICFLNHLHIDLGYRQYKIILSFKIITVSNRKCCADLGKG